MLLHSRNSFKWRASCDGESLLDEAEQAASFGVKEEAALERYEAFFVELAQNGGGGGCAADHQRVAEDVLLHCGEEGDPGALCVARAPCRGTMLNGEQGDKRQRHHGKVSRRHNNNKSLDIIVQCTKYYWYFTVLMFRHSPVVRMNQT